MLSTTNVSRGAPLPVPENGHVAAELATEAGGSKTAGVVVVIPAYNEERFIGSVVLKARRYADLVMVVDDGSTDGTAEIAEAAGARVARHPHNQGKGAALNTGFRAVRELNPEVMVLLDGDGQHLCRQIPLVMAPVLAGEADIVRGDFQARPAAAAATLTAGIEQDARPRGLLEAALAQLGQ